MKLQEIEERQAQVSKLCEEGEHKLKLNEKILDQLKKGQLLLFCQQLTHVLNLNEIKTCFFRNACELELVNRILNRIFSDKGHHEKCFKRLGSVFVSQ